jgi:chemotaxis response regulator CheB
MASILSEVANKVLRAAKARVWQTPAPATFIEQQPSARILEKKVRPLRNQDKIVVIGSSTGGPRL